MSSNSNPQHGFKGLLSLKDPVSGQPFLAVVDLEPYNPSKYDHQKIVRIDQLSSPKIHPEKSQYKNTDAHLQQMNLRPRNIPQSVPQLKILEEINGLKYPLPLKCLSIFFLIANLSLTISTFTWFILFATNLSRFFYYDGAQILIWVLIVCYSVTMAIRLVFLPIFGCNSKITTGQKVAIAISLFWPSLKYHIMRKEIRRFNSSMKTLLGLQLLSISLMLMSGIFGLIIYPHSHCNQWIYYYMSNQFVLLFGIMVLCSSVSEVVILLINIGWLRYNLRLENKQQERIRNLAMIYPIGDIRQPLFPQAYA